MWCRRRASITERRTRVAMPLGRARPRKEIAAPRRNLIRFVTRPMAGAYCRRAGRARPSESVFATGRVPNESCSRLPAAFRHDPDLLREDDEARVVLVGAQKRIIQQRGDPCVV